MDTGIIIAMITGVLTISGASLSYFQSRHKDREQERRRLKTDSYKDLLIALARAQQMPIQNPSAEQSAAMFTVQRTFYETCDTVNAIASESVVKALDIYIKASNNLATMIAMARPQPEVEYAFNIQITKYSELVYAIRDELGATNSILRQEKFLFVPWVANPNSWSTDQTS